MNTFDKYQRHPLILTHRRARKKKIKLHLKNIWGGGRRRGEKCNKMKRIDSIYVIVNKAGVVVVKES